MIYFEYMKNLRDITAKTEIEELKIGEPIMMDGREERVEILFDNGLFTLREYETKSGKKKIEQRRYHFRSESEGYGTKNEKVKLYEEKLDLNIDKEKNLVGYNFYKEEKQKIQKRFEKCGAGFKEYNKE